MASVNILCIGKLKEKFFREAQAEYTKRLSAFCSLNIEEKKEAVIPKNASETELQKAVIQESNTLLQSGKGYQIALSPEGKRMTSEQFSKMMKQQSIKNDISFFIGGSYGLSTELKDKADLVLSFSDMTMPHQLFRIVLLEQIYRSFMITSGRTYHK